MVEPGITLVDAAELKRINEKEVHGRGLTGSTSRGNGQALNPRRRVRDPLPRTVRVAYYAEQRIAKGGVNLAPNITFEKTGAASGIVHGDNGLDNTSAIRGSTTRLTQPRRAELPPWGWKKTGHSGMLSTTLSGPPKNGLVAIAMCQSDPMVVPYGERKLLWTNPIAFAAPTDLEKASRL